MKDKFFGDGFSIRVITVFLFILLSAAGLAFSFYLFSVANTTYIWAIALGFFLLSLLSGFFNVSASILYYRSYFYGIYLERIKKGLKPLTNLPTVAVVVAVYNEDVTRVKNTLLGLKKMNYPEDKIKFYLLDDSTKENGINKLSKFSRENKIEYIHRSARNGFKAGALNNMLSKSGEEFIAIFDYDETLTNPDFLMDTLPYFQDPKLAYIQTEKTHSKGNLFSDSVKMFDAFFFKFIEPARALNNTAIFAGSCGIIRRKALEATKGFPEYIIEDTFFSFESDRMHYKSLYIPKVYALGKPIKKFTELIKQQWRYNYGDTQFISYFFKRRKSLRRSPLSHMDYIVHGFGLNYISVTLILFTIISIFIVFSSVPFVNLTVHQILQAKYLSTDLEIFGTMSLILSFFIPVVLTKIYFHSVKKGFMLFGLNFALAFVRMKAAVAAILRMNPTVHWNRQRSSMKKNILFSIMNTKLELTFAGAIFVLSYFAIITAHLTGGVWLMWYGIMYLFTTIFLYKYG